MTMMMLIINEGDVFTQKFLQQPVAFGGDDDDDDDDDLGMGSKHPKVIATMSSLWWEKYLRWV